MRHRYLWVVLVLVGGAACHAHPPAVAPPVAPTPAPPPPSRVVPPVRPPAAAPPAPSVPPPASPTEAEIFARTSLADLNAAHPLADSFFAYDQFALSDDARQALTRDAEWLKKWPQVAIRIEGQCDERGTAEYNLALGERRAAAVERYLADLGIDQRRMTKISLGKESPTCAASTESCWLQNRRGHFVITAK